MRQPAWSVVFGLCLLSSPLSAPAHAAEPAFTFSTESVPASTPQQALDQIEVAAPFVVELIAAEPLTQDPVDFDWGPDGKLWVVEMADYPNGLDGKGSPGGRIRVLEDRDGDGVYDTSTLFANNLSTPNGILVWREGVLVTACPDVLYLADTTGDGKADHVEKLYTGFAPGNQQHRVNGLRWGLDHWIYLANGDSGGTVRSVRTGQEIDIRGRDLRIDPETGALEAIAGQTQFGRNRDDWGHWFGCNNPNPIFHYVLDDHYLRRSPHIAPPPIKRDIRSGETLVYPIGPIISHCDPKYRPIGATPRFTSACGTIVYRDNLFGPDYENVTFTSEPVYNIVHARKLIPNGVSFESVKLQGEALEFFRSKDPWCRPTALHVGPDGALYVADMVREVIEHPEWIDDNLERTLNVRAGAEYGRLYRIAPRGVPRRQVPRFDKLTTSELVAALESSSGWQRDLVQRMLIWKHDLTAVGPLRALLASSSRPLTRLHALYTLSGLQQLSSEDVSRGLSDTHPGVRRHAIILAEQFRQQIAANPAVWEPHFAPLVDDADPHVRLQLAYTLGELTTDWSARHLARLAVAGRDDADLTAAILSSLSGGNVATVTAALLESRGTPPEVLGRVAAVAVRLGHRDAAAAVLNASAPGAKTWLLLGTWFNQLGPEANKLDQLLTPPAFSAITNLLDESRQLVFAAAAPVEQRVAAIRLLARQPQLVTSDLEQLASLLRPDVPIQIQQSVVARLAELNDQRVPQILIANWPSHGPQIRQQIIDVLLNRPAWGSVLCDQLQAGVITSASLSSAQQSALRQHRDAGIRDRANELLGQISSDRADSLEAFTPAIDRVSTAHSTDGRKVFEKKCSSCHRLGTIGTAIGPNLAALATRTPEAILLAIIDPNRAAEAKYLQYQVALNDGRVLTGMIVEETATSITLVSTDAKLQTLLRSDIDALQGSSLSLMPVGLEKDLDLDAMASLIAFVLGPHESAAP